MGKYGLTLLPWILVLTISGCDDANPPYDVVVRNALIKVDYADGISSAEAKAIANAYLVIHGAYENRPGYARMSDGGGVWLGRVYMTKSMSMPVDANLPPVVVDKKSGTVSWKYGPKLAKIDLKVLDEAHAKHIAARAYKK
jgi:hypothetical protein